MPSEWWTYSVRDLLLFSRATYFRLFELYHEDIRPFQILAIAAAVLLIWLLWTGRRPAALLMLAAAWSWIAWGFHLQRYATINFAAKWYAVFFVLQALLLIATAVRERSGNWWLRPRPSGHPLAGHGGPRRQHGAPRWSVMLFGVAVVIYPAAGAMAGRPWDAVECFGLTPDVTALATLAVTTFLPRRRVVASLVPLFWCVTTATTLWALRAGEWMAVVVMCATTVALAIAWSRRPADRTG